MATVPYQSSQSNGGTASPLVITKPVSLAVGDLLIANVAVSFSGAANPIVAPAGWSTLSTGGDANRTFTKFYKFADAADVAGSSFSFTFAGSVSNAEGAVSRFTNASAVDHISSGSGFSTTTITPSGSMSTILILVGAFNIGSGSVAGYAVANNNPTWTEAYDVSNGVNAIGVSMAYGSYPSPLATGTASVTATGYIVGDTTVINIIPAQVTILSLVSAFIKPTVRIQLTSPMSLISSVIAPTVSAVTNLWSNVAKNISTWTNQSKS